jgi:hypothetical protein
VCCFFPALHCPLSSSHISPHRNLPLNGLLSTPPADAAPAPDQAPAPLPPAAAPPLGAPLFEPSDRRGPQLIEHLAPKRGRDALTWLRKVLKDALRAEKAAPAGRAKLGAGVTAGELEGLVGGLLAAPGAEGGGLEPGACGRGERAPRAAQARAPVSIPVGGSELHPVPLTMASLSCMRRRRRAAPAAGHFRGHRGGARARQQPRVGGVGRAWRAGTAGGALAGQGGVGGTTLSADCEFRPAASPPLSIQPFITSLPPPPRAPSCLPRLRCCCRRRRRATAMQGHPWRRSSQTFWRACGRGGCALGSASKRPGGGGRRIFVTRPGASPPTLLVTSPQPLP